MKKAILSFFLTTILLTSGVHAQQAVNQCEDYPISSSNYPICCPSTVPFVAARCVDYKEAMCAARPQDPICSNPIRGGTQQTGPVNGGTSTQDSTAGATPHSGSNELATCSKIRLKSALDILIWLKCIIVVAIIPLIFALAFVVFLWGVFKFMTASDVKAKQEGQKVIWWGMLGLFVMVSVWGIIKILGTTLGIESTVPTLQTTYLK